MESFIVSQANKIKSVLFLKKPSFCQGMENHEDLIYEIIYEAGE